MTLLWSFRAIELMTDQRRKGTLFVSKRIDQVYVGAWFPDRKDQLESIVASGPLLTFFGDDPIVLLPDADDRLSTALGNVKGIGIAHPGNAATKFELYRRLPVSSETVKTSFVSLDASPKAR
jgi:hypothetical protein